MLSFGEVRNLLKRLEDCNRSMGFLGFLECPRTVLEEREIKAQPVQFYLRLIHYALVEHSPQLYSNILEILPNIKAMADLKFVEAAFTVARRLLGLAPVITPEQLLMPNKWLEKKLEFVAELCEGVLRWEAVRKKRGQGQGGELKNFMRDTQPSKYLPPKAQKEAPSNEESDDEDLLVQREITVKPTEFIPPSKPAQQPKPASKEMLQQTKPNVFPKTLRSQFMEEDEEEDSNEFIATTKPPQRPLPAQKQKPNPGQVVVGVEGGQELVTKQQFNEVLQMLSSINGTVNGLVAKFNSFQSNVSGWFNNANARLLLLEENVKMIKSNL